MMPNWSLNNVETEMVAAVAMVSSITMVAWLGRRHQFLKPNRHIRYSKNSIALH